MLIEAITHPITYRWPGGEIRLEPGKPVELPDDRAHKLLAKARHKVQVITAGEAAAIQHDWVNEWRRLVAIVLGITADDPRYGPTMAALDRCDQAYLSNDWSGFLHAAAAVRQAVNIRS